MSKNTFFRPTPTYREFIILDSIDKNKDITQRELSIKTGVAVSMINGHLKAYEKKGLIKKKYLSTKTVEYFLTKKGLEQKKVLNIGYLSSSLTVYNQAKENIMMFLNQIVEKGFNNIMLYGAGEVAEILLQTLKLNKDLPINIVAVVDDDISKQQELLVGKKVIQLASIKEYEHDGVLISSYSNWKQILNNLVSSGYNTKKILQFFE